MAVDHSQVALEKHPRSGRVGRAFEALHAGRIDGIHHGHCHTNLDLQELCLEYCSLLLHVHSVPPIFRTPALRLVPMNPV